MEINDMPAGQEAMLQRTPLASDAPSGEVSVTGTHSVTRPILQMSLTLSRKDLDALTDALSFFEGYYKDRMEQATPLGYQSALDQATRLKDLRERITMSDAVQIIFTPIDWHNVAADGRTL